jgi:putative tryptophan/tyrosine transport system substrate-binding protein
MSVPRWRFSCICIALILALVRGAVWPAVGAAEDYHVAIMTSQDAQPYQEVLLGFREYLSQHNGKVTFDEYPLQGNADRANQALLTIKANGTRLRLTVGSFATQIAVQEGGELPIVACLIVNANDLQKATNATGVVLEFPLEIQFQWMHRFLPQNRTVGVLFNPQENQRKIEDATRVAKSMGLTLVPREVQSPQALPEALHSLAQEADVLWGITDQIVVSPQTAEPLLLFSFRNRIPLIGLSTPWVKAGALYALDRDYVDLGAQCGELALQVLQGQRASALPAVPPRKVLYALNLKTARHMKVDIPQSLIDGAQQIFR